MKTKDIKENINKEMECLISSDFSSVISKIENKKGVIIEMEKPKHKNSKLLGLSLSFAAIILVMIGVFGFNSFNKDTVEKEIAKENKLANQTQVEQEKAKAKEEAEKVAKAEKEKADAEHKAKVEEVKKKLLAEAKSKETQNA